MIVRSDEAHVHPTVRTARSIEGSTVTCDGVCVGCGVCVVCVWGVRGREV